MVWRRQLTISGQLFGSKLNYGMIIAASGNICSALTKAAPTGAKHLPRP